MWQVVVGDNSDWSCDCIIVFTVAACGLQTENNTKVKCNILLLAYVVIDGSVCVCVCVAILTYKWL